MNRGNEVGKLEGKVAFVSGGSQGIGEQIALLFGREGASVAVLASSDLAKAENVAMPAGSPTTSATSGRTRDASMLGLLLGDKVAQRAAPVQRILHTLITGPRRLR
jgi:NAD(P)-dependent dehydrogenase (short-subunit alcohol dehydrogenase family)